VKRLTLHRRVSSLSTLSEFKQKYPQRSAGLSGTLCGSKEDKVFCLSPEITETDEFLKIAYAKSFHRFFALIFCFVKT
jgi:hypothetical protein